MIALIDDLLLSMLLNNQLFYENSHL